MRARGQAGSFNTCTGPAQCKLCGYHVTFLRGVSVQNIMPPVKGHFWASAGARVPAQHAALLSKGYEKGDQEMKEMREIKAGFDGL